MAAKATTVTDRLNRWLEDADVRDNVVRAAESLRQASKLVVRRQPAVKTAKSKRLQHRLRDAASSLGRARTAAREAEEKRVRSQRRRRILLLGLAGGGAAIAVSGPARSKLRGLFDGQEETPEPPPPPDAQLAAVEPS